MNYLLIGLGGGLGAVCRFILGGYITSLFSSGLKFPVGTFVVNVLGSLLMGLLLGLTNTEQSNNMIVFSVIGFCGGFTTFSTFSIETMLMLKNGDYWVATLYMLLSLSVCVIATVAGFALKKIF